MLLLLFLGVKRYAPSLKAVYPQQCTFLIDEQFSAPFQATLQAYVHKKYNSCKDLKQTLDHVSLQFHEVIGMNAYVCKTDQLCFTIEAVKPLFVLNDFVVGVNLQLMQNDHYNLNVISNLHRITATLPCDVRIVADFFQHVPDSIFKKFNVEWHDRNEVVLSQKESGVDELLFCMSNKPTEEAISFFEKIKHKKQKKKKQIFDFRFNNQIVIK